MTVTRDFLEAPDTVPTEKGIVEHLAAHTNYLQDIANYTKRQVADVLAVPVVRGVSQQGAQTITDTNSHEVKFEVGGKPVEIFKLLIFSTYTGNAAMSPVGMSKLADGIRFIANDVREFNFPTHSVFLMCDLGGAVNLVVNGPALSPGGGIFLYGYTIPDWDRTDNQFYKS
jgi:hypothetical protein